MNNWVCVKADSKIPYRAFEPSPASCSNFKTWSSFDVANESVRLGNYSYLGYVFHDNGIVGIDIDTGYDEDGFLSPEAVDIINRCQSYTEKSKSGRGFHIILYGNLPTKGKNNLNGIEIYKDGRFFVMTGDTFQYDTIIENQEAIDYIFSTYFKDSCDVTTDNEMTERIYKPLWSKYEGGKVSLNPIYPPMNFGARNLCLTSLAGSLHTTGYNAVQILNEIKRANQEACNPPISDRELETIVKSVTRYKR